MKHVQLALPIIEGRLSDAHWRVERPFSRIPCGPIAIRLASDEVTAEATLRCQRCSAQRTVERTIWSPFGGLWYAQEPVPGGMPPFGGELVEPVADCARTDPFGCGDLIWLHDLSAAFRTLLERLRREADAGAALAALPFHEITQATVYAAMVCDRRGYARQLVEQHPGIASLAATAEPLTSWPAQTTLSGPVWSSITEGRQLREVLSTVTRTLGLEGESRARLAWLARRIGPNIDPWLVIAAARCVEAPQSDFPPSAEHRRLWVMAMAAARSAISDEDRGEAWAVAAMRYVSAHYARFVFLPSGVLRRLMRGLRARDKRVPRRLDFDRLVEGQERWWERWTRMHSARDALDEFRRRGVVALPTPPFSGSRSLDFAIEPITTPEQLLLEGERMQHCIFSYCPVVLDGYAAVYRVQCEGVRSTVLLARAPGNRWRLREHRGLGNRLPELHEKAAVHRWLLAAEAETRAGRAQ